MQKQLEAFDQKTIRRMAPSEQERMLDYVMADKKDLAEKLKCEEKLVKRYFKNQISCPLTKTAMKDCVSRYIRIKIITNGKVLLSSSKG